MSLISTLSGRYKITLVENYRSPDVQLLVIGLHEAQDISHLPVGIKIVDKENSYNLRALQF